MPSPAPALTIGANRPFKATSSPPDIVATSEASEVHPRNLSNAT